MFDTSDRKRTLADLFNGRSQMVVYHFMFAADWAAGCPGCSFPADHLDGALPHLNHHDVTLLAVFRAPLAQIEAYRRRMGWRFPWVSSFASSFNHDYHVSFSNEELETGSMLYNFTETNPARANDELPGLSGFFRDDSGEVLHAYSTLPIPPTAGVLKS